MSSSKKILSFEIENVKRVQLVRMAPSETGLTVIGGNNAQGKTSVLDAILYALGGEKYRPSDLQRKDGLAPARIRLELSGGLIVERRGKNAALHVTDATGTKRGQKLLDSFVEILALNLPKFLAMRDEEKAHTLLRTLGIDDQLAKLDLREKAAYDKRHDYAVIVDQKRKFAAELKEYADVPETPVSVAEMIAESQAILQRNADRQKARNNLANLKAQEARIKEEGRALQEAIQAKMKELDKVSHLIIEAEKNPISEDESTAELEAKIADIDEINAKVRANLDKQKALTDASECEQHLSALTADLEAVRAERKALLDGAVMPLPELAIGKDEKGNPVLLYAGHPWDCMSTMEQYRTAAAIVHKLKPECGFVLMDGLECFDPDQLKALDQWLQETDLQAICTRVGKDDCSIVIEDGYAVQDGVEAAPEIPDPNDPIPMNETVNQKPAEAGEKEW